MTEAPFPPPGACDCHIHTIGPFDRYPLADERPYTPHEATAADMHAMLARQGLSRAVVVQPSIYGFDNRCTMDAVDSLNGQGRAVVVTALDATSAELEALHARGARGYRINAVSTGENEAAKLRDRISQVARLCAPLGWHVQMFINPATLAQLADFIPTLPVPVVIDHFGLIAMGPEGAEQTVTMANLLRTGRVWVKLSGTYRVSKDCFDTQLTQLARKLASANPDRVVWASDWPHTPGGRTSGIHPHQQQPNQNIDTKGVLEFVREWFPDAAMQQRLLVDNPAALYGF